MEAPLSNATDTPIQWSALSFHPLGIYDLRRRMGLTQSSAFTPLRNRFEAAEIAWFAAGLASQPANVQSNQFYPELHVLRDNTRELNGTETRKALRTRLRNVTFDCATLLDRAFGGTTLVIHVPGTTRPGAPKHPEYVKADVCFPGHLAREDSRYSTAVSKIVQAFIADIGIPNIERYERCAALHWSLPPPNCPPPAFAQQSIQPNASPPGSSIFTYHGQQKPIVVIDDEDEDFGFTASQYQLIGCIESESVLKDELKFVRQCLKDTQDALADFRRHEDELLAEVKRLTIATSRPVSPIISRLTPRTPERSTPANRFRSPQAPLSPSNTLSVQASARALRQGLLIPGTPDSRGGSSQSSNIYSNLDNPAVALYGSFITEHELEAKFFAIECIRTGTVAFLWQNELLKAGIPEAIVAELMALMNAST